MICPRCNNDLKPGTYQGVSLYKCSKCNGCLIQQKNLIPLLDQLGLELGKTMNLDIKIGTIPDNDIKINCPECGKAMNHYGYMGANNVFIDSCSECWLIWLDPLEIGVMALLYKRTNNRDEYRRLQSISNETDIGTANVITQAVSQAFLICYILG